jgi:hypothetical protein
MGDVIPVIKIIGVLALVTVLNPEIKTYVYPGVLYYKVHTISTPFVAASCVLSAEIQGIVVPDA